MTAPLTSEQATELLRKQPDDYRTPQKLRELASMVDADAPGRLTVLYSGPGAKNIWSTDIVNAMLEAGEAVRVINRSEAAKFLDSREFYNSLADAYDVDVGKLIDRSYRGPAADWLYHPSEGPWADASARFADATKGEVRAIVPDADPSRVFGATEVPRILANPEVTMIEGIPREALAGVSKTRGHQAAFEIIVARSREHVANLRTPISDELLKSGNRPLRLDSRDYFAGTDVEGRPPSFYEPTNKLAGRMNAPTVHAEAGQATWIEWQGSGIRANPERVFPPLARAGTIVGLAGLGAVAAVHDAKETGERIGTALAQDNPTGAESEAARYAARGLGGAAAVLTPAAAGIGGGPAVALAVADAYLLTQAFDRGAQYLDVRKITHQTDRDGVQWEYTGRQWLRDDLKADLRDDAVAQEHRQTFSALPDKARELNYLASVEAVSQAIGKADARNPFELPANANDASSNQPSPWQLDAGSGAWQRTRYVDMDPSDARMPDRAVPENAGPVRATELDRQASQIIDENIRQGPAALAAQYQIGHKRNGFDQVGQEPMSVQTALNPDTLEASDGKQYLRNAQGAWSQDGTPASDIRALELETTRQRLLPALEHHRTQLAAVPEWQPLSPEQQDRANLRQLYADHGVNPNAQRFEAAYQAVQQERVAQGITAQTTSLALEPRPTGAYDIDTPIQHLRIEGAGVVRVAATTTAADIARTETALQMAPAATDAPGEQQRIATTAEPATQGIAVTAPLKDAVRDQPNQQRADQAANAARVDTPAVDTQADVSPAMPRTPTKTTNPAADTLAQPVSGLSSGPTAAAAAQTAPAIDDIRQASHPGNGGYRMLASRVDMFEKQNGIEHGPHSQRLAASLSALSTREQLDPQRLFLQRDERGAITLVQRTRAGEPESAEVRIPIDAQALGAQPIDVSSRAHAAALSHHYAVMAEYAQRREAQTRDAEARRRDDPRFEGRGIGERSNHTGPMHASANQDGRRTDGTDPRQRTAPDDALAALTPNDRALFDRIRQDVPPTIPDTHVAQALLRGKKNHINGAADVDRVAVVGDRILMLGTLQTGAARVAHDASQPAQTLEATVQQTQSHNRQLDQNQQIASQQSQQQGQGGHAR